MAGEGFSKHASTSLRENRNLRRKKNIFKKEKSFFIRRKEYLKERKGILHFKKVSTKELAIIKEKIALKAKNDGSRQLLILILLLILVILIGVVFFNSQARIENKNKETSSELYIQENIEEFNYLVSSGDDWLTKKKYHNAIFQYKLALKLFPNDSVANYRLLSAYDIRCQKQNKGCDKKETLLENLMKNN